VGFDAIGESEELMSLLKEYKKASNEKVKTQLRNMITIACLPFVKKISHGLARRSTDPVEDLIQVGSVGLLKAIDQYKEGHGTSFKTYATYLITGEIRHYLRDRVSMIRAPRELHELSFRINQIMQKLTAELGQTPTDIEIAEELQIPVSRVSEVTEIDRRKQLLSLDQVISKNTEGDQYLVDKLVDNKYQDYLTAQEDRIMLFEAVEKLDDSLKQVIKMSFFDDMSQNQIAKELGISQMQVSRRIRKALAELLKIITSSKEYSKS